MKQRFTYSLIAVGISLVSAAQDGTNSYNWLDVTSSAHIYGLGGINISLVDDDLSTTDQNPALLGGEMSGQLLINYMRYIGDTNFAGVKYAHSLGERGAWAASVQYFGYGSMDERLADGTLVGSFSPQDLSFAGTYSHDITDRLRGGVNFKVLYSHYGEYSAFALATDVGINYFDPEHETSLSVVFANMGGQIKRFDEAYNRLPFDIRLGWSQIFGNFPVRFSVTAWNLTKWHLPYVDYGDGTDSSQAELKDSFGSNLFRHLVFGADLVSSQNFYIGLGYSYKTRTDMSTYSRSMLSGWSVAAGIRGRNFGVDLAFAQPHTGATTFMVNLNLALEAFLH